MKPKALLPPLLLITLLLGLAVIGNGVHHYLMLILVVLGKTMAIIVTNPTGGIGGGEKAVFGVPTVRVTPVRGTTIQGEHVPALYERKTRMEHFEVVC